VSKDQATFIGQINTLGGHGAEASQSTSPVTFHVFRKDGSRNPDIKYSFIEKRLVSFHDAAEGFIRLDDNTMWALVMENEVKAAMTGSTPTYCIISFQARVNGNFAVARLFKDDYKAKGRHS